MVFIKRAALTFQIFSRHQKHGVVFISCWIVEDVTRDKKGLFFFRVAGHTKHISLYFLCFFFAAR